MTSTFVLASIGAIVLILTVAAQIPAAATELIRGCIVLVEALRELCAALNRAKPAVSANKIQPDTIDGTDQSKSEVSS